MLTAARSAGSQARYVDRDQHGGPRVDRFGHADEGEARAPGPLCDRALEILDAARTLGDGNPLVFPMRSGRPISASTLPKMLQYHRSPLWPTASGRRSGTGPAEETDHPREVIEAALAHVVQNKVEAAYARSDLLERRRRLMDDYMDGNADEGTLP